MFTMYMAKVSKKADITQKLQENLFLHEEPLAWLFMWKEVFFYIPLIDQDPSSSYPISAEKEKSLVAAHDTYGIRRNLTLPQ